MQIARQSRVAGEAYVRWSPRARRKKTFGDKMTRIKACSIVGLMLLFVVGAYSVEPIKQVLSQDKLDRFLNDLEVIMTNQEIKQAWNECYEQVSFDEIMDPNSSLLVDDTLTAVMTIMVKTSQKAKLNVAATNILKKYKWTNEFWDIYVTVMISVHYKTVIDGNEELRKQTGEQGNADSSIMGLPPISNFINMADYELVVRNYSKIQGKIDNEIARNNGFNN